MQETIFEAAHHRDSDAAPAPPVDEALALKVFEDSDRCVGERRRLRTAGLAMTAAWVRGNNSFIEWIRPDAGAFCCIRLKPHLYDDAAVGRFHAALAERGVRVALRLVTEALKQTSRAAA